MIKFKFNPTSNQRITSEFGKRNFAGMQWHSGVDLGAIVPGIEGDEIYAVDDGVVRVSKADSGNKNIGYGYYIVMEHDEYCTLFAHLQSLELKVGESVKAGQVIGHMGNTGESTAVHLHFEIRNCKYNHPYFWTKGTYTGQFIMCVNPESYFIKPHWAEKHKLSLENKGIKISDERYDDFMTRGEVFALLDRIIK